MAEYKLSYTASEIDNKLKKIEELDGAERITNKSNVISENSTDEQYSTAKAVFDFVAHKTDTQRSSNPKIWELDKGWHYITQGFYYGESENDYFALVGNVVIYKPYNANTSCSFCGLGVVYNSQINLISGSTDYIDNKWQGYCGTSCLIEEINAGNPSNRDYPSEKAVVDFVSSYVESNTGMANVEVATGDNIDSVGTPTVTKSEQNGNVIFTFDYLKGEKGDKGDTGLQGEAGKDGVKGEDGSDGKDGIGISKAEINNSGELVLTYSNNTTTNLGSIKGETGADGKSITSITTDENNNVIVTFSDGTEQNIGQLHVDVQADFLTSGGFGNLRFTDNKFQYYDEATSQWVDTQMTSENVTIMNLSPQPMQTFSANFNPDTKNVELYINESADTIIGGQTASTVEKVIIRRKKDTFPIDENDGDLILITERKNFGAYKRVPYIDVIENVQIGDTYCYKAFPINNVGLVGYSASNESKFTTKDYWLFGFKLDQNESDPASMIRYIEDNENYQSAYMDYDADSFNYGNWGNAWFMKVKPCMLNYDGTVAYYLDLNDYTLKEDGTVSDITDVNFTGNAMVGIPKTYWKIVDNGDDTANIYFSNKKVDEDFHCWSHIDNNGNEIDYCYMPIYNGYNDGTKLRSLSDKTPIYEKTAEQEINLAKTNNQDDNIIWYTEVYSDRMLINLLLLLIGKSTDTQTVFGNGYYTGGSSVSNPRIATGKMDLKGLFWGSNDSSMVGVKVFGMEHWWGNAWRRIAGWINNKGIQKVKLVYGQFDGSTVDGYNTDGTGYIALNNSTPSGTSGGYIGKMSFDSLGLIPKKVNGSATTYFTDGLYYSTTQISYALVGGNSNASYRVGALYAGLRHLATATDWAVNASISCKPLAPTEEVE